MTTPYDPVTIGGRLKVVGESWFQGYISGSGGTGDINVSEVDINASKSDAIFKSIAVSASSTFDSSVTANKAYAIHLENSANDYTDVINASGDYIPDGLISATDTLTNEDKRLLTIGEFKVGYNELLSAAADESFTQQISSDLSNETTRVTAISGDLSNETIRVTTISSDLSNETTRVTTISGDLSNETTRVTTISGDLSTQTTKISGVSSDLSNETTRVTTISSDLSTQITKSDNNNKLDYYRNFNEPDNQVMPVTYSSQEIIDDKNLFANNSFSKISPMKPGDTESTASQGWLLNTNGVAIHIPVNKSIGLGQSSNIKLANLHSIKFEYAAQANQGSDLPIMLIEISTSSGEATDDDTNRFIICPYISTTNGLWQNDKCSVTYTILPGFDTYIPTTGFPENVMKTESLERPGNLSDGTILKELGVLYNAFDSEDKKFAAQNTAVGLTCTYCECKGDFTRPINVNNFVTNSTADWELNTIQQVGDFVTTDSTTSILDWYIKGAYAVTPHNSVSNDFNPPGMKDPSRIVKCNLEQVTWKLREPRAITPNSIESNYNIKYNNHNLVNGSGNGIVAVPTDYLSSSGTSVAGDWTPNGSEIEESPRFYNFVVTEQQDGSQKYIVTPHIVNGECKKSVNNMMLLMNDHLVIDSLFKNFFI